MTDPWPDVRERLRIAKAWGSAKGTCPRDLADVLTDAESLLAVVQAVQELQKRPPLSDTYEAMFERLEQLDRTLAALPNHLKTTSDGE